MTSKKEYANVEYSVASAYRDQCVSSSGSYLWPGHSVWTQENLAIFMDCLSSAPAKGSSFVDTLALQLEGQSVELSMLAVELVLLYCLFPHNDKLGREAKVQKVSGLASLRGLTLPNDRVEKCFSLGIGYPGTYYLARPQTILKSFATIIRWTKSGTAFDSASFVGLARRLLSEKLCDATAIHTLAHLFFPDNFEPIISEDHREKIIARYEEYVTERSDSDQALRDIRLGLTRELARDFSFYEIEVRSQWDHSSRPGDPIPSMEDIMLPFLQLLEDGNEHKESDLVDYLANHFELSPEERQSRLPSGSELVLNNRVRFAKMFLRQARLLDIPHEGFVILTGRGRELLDENPTRLTRSSLKRFPEFVAFLNRSPSKDDRGNPASDAEGAPRGNVWIEKTIVQGRSDRVEGTNAIGKALWSPVRDSSGKDIYRFMRDVQPGDTVLHLTDNRGFTAISQVKGPVEIFGGVMNTEWGEQESYRVPLTNHRVFEQPLQREVFFREPYGSKLRALRSQGKTNLFYTNGLELVQGGYLTPAPPELLAILNGAYADLTGGTLVESPAMDSVDSEEVAASLADLQLTTLWREDELNAIIDAVSPTTEKPSRQIIFSGPPGTGKTWVARQIAKYLADGDERRCRLIQFHPSFSYEQFVEGLRPESHGGAISFRPVPGILLEMSEKCRNRPETYFLIIDEINRANLPRVFGELMYLMEYREDAVDLPYTRGFKLPDNLYIFATMNTADRSARAIDLALRRRFEIFECPPRRDILERYYETHTNQVPDLFDGFELINAQLAADIDRHHTIGHTYLMSPVFSPRTLQNVWNRRILPLVEEYFFDQPHKLTEYSIEVFWPSARK